MSHKDAPPESETQRHCREFWTAHLGASSVGWGRGKDGRFLAEFARNAEEAWRAAQLSTPNTEAQS